MTWRNICLIFLTVSYTSSWWALSVFGFYLEDKSVHPIFPLTLVFTIGLLAWGIIEIIDKWEEKIEYWGTVGMILFWAAYTSLWWAVAKYGWHWGVTKESEGFPAEAPIIIFTIIVVIAFVICYFSNGDQEPKKRLENTP